MQPTPTPFPEIVGTPIFDLSSSVDVDSIVYDALSLWNIGLGQSGIWEQVSSAILIVIIAVCFYSIIRHMSYSEYEY